MPYFFPDLLHLRFTRGSRCPGPAWRRIYSVIYRESAVHGHPYPLDMSGYPSFTRRLLAAVRQIPYGKTCSYREIAAAAGSPRSWRGCRAGSESKPPSPC